MVRAEFPSEFGGVSPQRAGRVLHRAGTASSQGEFRVLPETASRRHSNACAKVREIPSISRYQRAGTPSSPDLSISAILFRLHHGASLAEYVIVKAPKTTKTH